MKVNYQTTLIVVAMVLGIVAGYVCNSLISPEAAKEIAGYFAIVTDIFLRLIKMIIAPLVFATLVAGLASMGDAGTVGRIGGKAVGWFLDGLAGLADARPDLRQPVAAGRQCGRAAAGCRRDGAA